MNNRFDYKYSLDQCDVKNKASCQEFRNKRLEWMECLSGDDPHAISMQLSSAAWDYTLFCAVNELRRAEEGENDDSIGFNGPVIRMWDAGFASLQATAIRRLIERPKANPNWAVISIRSVLKDIEDNLDLITRENYVCYDGLPYDYNAVHDKWIASLPKTKNGVHAGVMPTTGPSAWHSSERYHENFDKLSQVPSENRSPTDLIKREIFEHLEAQIATCDGVKRYVDKFIAHGAAPHTRTSLSADDRKLTLEKLEACHRTLHQVAGFIMGPLLWESNIGGVPTPQYDQFKHLDKKWATEAGLKNAREKWHEIHNMVSGWESSSLWPPGFT